MNLRQALSLIVGIFVAGGVLVRRAGQNERCFNLLYSGRWISDYESFNDRNIWQPYGSILHPYNSSTIVNCLQNRSVFFLGDSAARQIFWAIAGKIDREEASTAQIVAGKHQDFSFNIQNATLRFYWDPYLNRSKSLEILRSAREHAETAAILLSFGLWTARFGGDEYLSEYNSSINRTLSIAAGPEVASLDIGPLIILPPPHLHYDQLNQQRAASLTPTRTESIVRYLSAREDTDKFQVAWAARQVTKSISSEMLGDGLHVSDNISAVQANLLLNKVCNDFTFNKTKYASSLACVKQTTWKPSWSTALACVLILPIICSVILDEKSDDRIRKRRLAAIVVLHLVLFYCWLADRTTVFPKANKIVSTQLYTLATVVFLIAGTIRVRCIPTTETLIPQSNPIDSLDQDEPGLLSRAQTEEWKGWMQIVILLYHYFGMSKVLRVYQLVRVLVASYLFLTGYGHASYFQSTTDFSLQRVATVLSRLNLLPCLLAIVMDNTYDFYYFPGLASLWFLVAFSVFWVPEGKHLHKRECVLRIATSCYAMRVVLHDESFISAILNRLEKLQGPRINPQEFLFRVKLDFYSPFLGMLLSILADQHALQPGATTIRFRQILRNAWPSLCVAASTTLLVIYCLIASQFSDKHNYNRWHPLLSALPISAYILARNINKSARRYIAPIFVWIGTISLELFVLQYHIWLAVDTKSLLRLGLIDNERFVSDETMVGSWTFWVESAVITGVFIWASHYTAQATREIVKWLMTGSGGAKQRRERRFLCVRLGVTILALWTFNLLSIMGNP